MVQDKAVGIIDYAVPRGGAANDGESAGAFLASARAAAGMAIEEIGDATKVKVAHLQAIEAMRADLLPPLPYTIGFVKAYARHMGLDADAVALRFREDIAATAAPAALDAARREKTELSGGAEGARIASVFAILAIILFGVWVMIEIIGGGRDANGSVETEAPRVRLGDAAAVAPTPRPSVHSQPATDRGSAPLPAETPSAGATEEGVVENAGTETPAAPDIIQTPADTEAPAISAMADPPAVASESERAAEPEIVQPQAELQSRPLPRRRQPEPPAPVIVESELVRSLSPAYPERCARRANPVESVTLAFDVSVSGSVTNARVASSTNDCFEAEALRTLSRWQFSPRTVNGSAATDAGKSATLNFRK